MLSFYEDILKRIEERPKWYDQNGVPRYDDFTPELCPNIYADEVVLLEIACQDCGRKFLVEMHWACYDGRPFRERIDLYLKKRKEKGWPPIHYGDPPIHGCVGDTMNCIDLRIIEFWFKGMPMTPWIRDKRCEIKLEAEDEEKSTDPGFADTKADGCMHDL